MGPPPQGMFPFEVASRERNIGNTGGCQPFSGATLQRNPICDPTPGWGTDISRPRAGGAGYFRRRPRTPSLCQSPTRQRGAELPLRPASSPAPRMLWDPPASPSQQEPLGVPTPQGPSPRPLWPRGLGMRLGLSVPASPWLRARSDPARLPASAAAGWGPGGCGCCWTPGWWLHFADRLFSSPPAPGTQKSSSSASSEASETCQSVSECSSPTSVSLCSAGARGGGQKVKPSSASPPLPLLCPPSHRGHVSRVGPPQRLGWFCRRIVPAPAPLSAAAFPGVTPCRARCRTGPRPAPTTSRWSPPCSGARTAWSTCGKPRWARPPVGTRASALRTLPGPGCHRLRLPPRWDCQWGEHRGSGLLGGSQERNRGADGASLHPQHGEEVSPAASDLAMVLTRGLSLEHQKSSRDSLQYSSGYSTQTTTPSCSEDTIPSQGTGPTAAGGTQGHPKWHPEGGRGRQKLLWSWGMSACTGCGSVGLQSRDVGQGG